MNGSADHTTPRRLSRETRHLLVAAFAALAALWVLARIRFPDRSPAPNPIPQILTQLSVRPTFGDLEAEIARLQERLAPALVSVDANTDADSGTPSPGNRDRSALRIRADVALALFDDVPESRIASALAVDKVNGLALFRVPADTRAFVPAPWSAVGFELPRYLLATVTTAGRAWLQPVVIGSLVPIDDPAWGGTVWRIASEVPLPPGTLLFTRDGELVGAIGQQDHEPIVVPGDRLLSTAQQLLARGTTPLRDIGVQVQELTAALRRATGSTRGVAIAWVDEGPASELLMVGDVIEAINETPVVSPRQWRVQLARLPAGEPLVLRVWRAAQSRTITIPALADTPRRSTDALGLTLRTRAGVGAEVLRVAPDGAGARAGVMTGDLITAIGATREPSATQVARAFTRAKADHPLLLAVRRGESRRLMTLER